MVWNVHRKNTRLVLEHFTSEVARAAVTTRAVVELGGVVLGVGNQVGQGVDVQPFRCVGVQRQHVGHPQHLRDRRDIFGRVVGQFAAQSRVDAVRRGGGNAQRQAGAHSLGGGAYTHVAARTGPVVHDHGAERSLDRFGQNACRHVTDPPATKGTTMRVVVAV